MHKANKGQGCQSKATSHVIRNGRRSRELWKWWKWGERAWGTTRHQQPHLCGICDMPVKLGLHVLVSVSQSLCHRLDLLSSDSFGFGSGITQCTPYWKWSTLRLVLGLGPRSISTQNDKHFRNYKHNSNQLLINPNIFITTTIIIL